MKTDPIKTDQNTGLHWFIVDVDDPSGKRCQVRSKGFKTKKAAREAMAAVVADASRGSYLRPARTTVERFLVDTWLPAKVPTLKASTAASYRQMVDGYVLPRLGA